MKRPYAVSNVFWRGICCTLCALNPFFYCTTEIMFLQHMELFYHTYERNPLSVLEALSRQPDAISLHPLKQPWMMHTHHQHVTQRLIVTARQVRSTLCHTAPLCPCQTGKECIMSHISSMSGRKECIVSHSASTTSYGCIVVFTACVIRVHYHSCKVYNSRLSALCLSLHLASLVWAIGV